MARVPVAEGGPQQSLQPYRTRFDVRATPGAFGAEIGKGVSDLGKSGDDYMQVQKLVQDKEDEALVKQKVDQLQDYRRDALFDPEKGYLSTAGESAVNGRAAYQEGFRKTRESIANGLTPNQARMFGDAATALENQGDDLAIRHQGAERKSWILSSHSGRAETALKDALADPNNDKMVNFSIATAAREIQAAGELQGKSMEEVEADVAKMQSGTLYNVALRKIEADPMAANTWIQAQGGRIQGEDAYKLQEALGPELRRVEANAESVRVWDALVKTNGNPAALAPVAPAPGTTTEQGAASGDLSSSPIEIDDEDDTDGDAGGPLPAPGTDTNSAEPMKPVAADPAPAAPAANQPAGTPAYLRYANQGATRNKPIDQKLVTATSFLGDMGVTMEVFSGGQDGKGEGDRRTGSVRHDHGGAADVFFYKDGRKLDWAKTEDRPIFEEIVKRGKAAGITGFGAGDGYMRPGSMHIGFGAPGVWGKGGKGANAAPWLKTAFGGAAAGAPAGDGFSPGVTSSLPAGAIAGMNLVKGKESFVGTAYIDWSKNSDGTRKHTGYRVGYGSDTITKADGTIVKVTPGMKVSRVDADRDLARRVTETQAGIIAQVGQARWDAMTPAAQAGLTSMTYNYGTADRSVLGDVMKAARNGDMAGVATAIAARASDNAGINRARRQEEAALVSGTGKLPAGSGGASGAFSPSANNVNYVALDEEISRIKDPRVQDLVRTQLSRRLELISKQEGANKDNAKAELWKFLDSGGTPDDAPMAIRQAAGMETVSSAWSYVKARDERTTPDFVDNDELVYKLNREAAEAPEVFARRDLYELRDQFSDGTWNSMQTLQRGILTPDKAAKEKGLDLGKGFRMADATLESLGITTAGESGSGRKDQAVQIAKFQNNLARLMQEQFQATGKQPTDIETQAMIRRLALPVIFENPEGTWYGGKDTRKGYLFEAPSRKAGETVQVNVQYDQVPIDSRVKIETALQAKLGRQPTQDEVTDLYERYVLETNATLE